MSDLGIAFKTDIDYTLATFKIELIGFSLKKFLEPAMFCHLAVLI